MVYFGDAKKKDQFLIYELCEYSNVIFVASEVVRRLSAPSQLKSNFKPHAGTFEPPTAKQFQCQSNLFWKARLCQ
jgi:hypothetical protein